MSKPEVAHHIVGFEGRLEITPVDPNTDSHKHMLGSLYNLFSIFDQVCALKSLEPEIIVVEVSLKIEVRLNLFSVLFDCFIHIISKHGCGPTYLVLDLGIETLGNIKEVVGGASV